MNDRRITLEDARSDWRTLDVDSFPGTEGMRLVSHEEFTSVPEIAVEYIAPWDVTEKITRCPLLYWFLYALRLFMSTNKSDVIIVNGGITWLWLCCGFLNASLLFGKRKLLCWDVFVEYILGTEKRYRFFPFIKSTTYKKERLARFVLRQYGLNVLWSRKQVTSHASHFNLPESNFIFLPFKANHSKGDTYDIPMRNFVFAGGNGKRDYSCLIEAVRGTDIPVIISATDPEVRKQIEPLPNVMVLGAPEPAFAQLQAASRFVVIPMKHSGLKGGGEANFCNAMWHRKPVIAVDSMSAADYVLNGETGFVVETGEISTLREKILLLWKNPDLCREMGLAGRKRVEKFYLHEKFIRRLLRLSLLYGKQQ